MNTPEATESGRVWMEPRHFSVFRSTQPNSSSKPDESVRNLAVGILAQAIRDLLVLNGAAAKGRDVWRDDATQWFESAGQDPGSLNWVCQILQLDSAHLRRVVRSSQTGDERVRDVWSRILRSLCHQA